MSNVAKDSWHAFETDPNYSDLVSKQTVEFAHCFHYAFYSGLMAALEIQMSSRDGLDQRNRIQALRDDLRAFIEEVKARAT